MVYVYGLLRVVSDVPSSSLNGDGEGRDTSEGQGDRGDDGERGVRDGGGDGDFNFDGDDDLEGDSFGELAQGSGARDGDCGSAERG
ncbi:hypothetical protein Nepgr_001645 [Nepenthes gracilis]|uniref:Uncharacterized protein n=1 Tax=Nepenthes gracilis TaxID=150966 RepID=A0AAD3P5A9_NEPGR|nr:hypothetical protein Nepgr_001645 [Nepenthes gracilis]